MAGVPLSPLDRRRLAFIAYSDLGAHPVSPVSSEVWGAFGIVAIHEGIHAPREATTHLRVDLALEPQPDVRPGLLIIELRKRLAELFPDTLSDTHLSFASRGLASLNLAEFIYGLLPLSSYWRMLVEHYRRTDLLVDGEWRDMLARVDLQGRARR